MTDSAPSRAALIVRRWGSLAAAACLATVVVALVFSTQTWVLRALLQREYITVVGAVFVVLAFLVQGAWGRPSASLGLKHFLSYPPLWVAGVTGAAGLIYSLALWPALRELVEVPKENAPLLRTVARVGVVATMVAALFIVAWVQVAGWIGSRRELKLKSRVRTAEGPEDGAKALIESWDKLRAWLVQDAAVDNAADDVLGHREIARRIATRLNPPCKEGDTGQPKTSASSPAQAPREKAGIGRAKDKARGGGIAQLPSQAVVGALGSGKTTVRHLVEQELAPNLRMVPVDLWPYHTPEAAVEGVLRTLIDAVAKEANVIAIRGLPTGYLRAMGSAGTIPSVLVNLVDPAPNPYDTLEGLDNLATAIGRRFVVWVEDLERFSAASKSDDSPPDALRMAPIWSLLFGLSQRRSITVITATVELQARFDLEKVARYIEELPPIAPSTGVPIIRAVRRHCLTFDIVNPSAGHAQRDWEAFDSDLAIQLDAAFGRNTMSIPSATVLLCRTPRTLKQGLRRVLDFWRRYAGEIDFDDLFLMAILREAEPSAFALIRDHWDEIAGVKRDEEVRTKARENFERRLARLQLPDSRHLAVAKIVDAVFDAEHPTQKLQSLRDRRYWLRFTSEPEIEVEDSDQLVLRTLLETNDDRVLDLLEGPQRQIVVRFSQMLSGKRLLQLFQQFVLRRVPEDPSRWFVEGEWISGHPPGMIPIWHMIGDQRRAELPPSSEIAQHVIDAFKAAIGNLHLVHELEHYFCSSKTHGGPINRNGSDESNRLVEQVRTRLWELLVEHYAGKPTLLANGLRSARVCALEYLVWGSLRIAQRRTSGTPFPNWDELATTILDAARLDTPVVLPQLASLVCDSHTTFESVRYTFNTERARLLFGDEARVLELFRNPPTVASEAEPLVSAVHAAAQLFARQAPPAVP